jgi:hypothetical protein
VDFRYLNNDVKLIVVDNTESEAILRLSRQMISHDYEQKDFPATEVDVIPVHQKKKWMTSIWQKQR